MKLKPPRPKNVMTIEECKLAFPKKSWLHNSNSQKVRAEIPEDTLQRYANEAIDLRKWLYLRFPDGFLTWMKLSAPPWISKIFFGQWGGKQPDNIILVKIGPGMFLAAKMEIKTTIGKTHGKQKVYAKDEEWLIVRSPEQINRALDNIGVISAKLKKHLEDTWIRATDPI